VVHFTPRPAVPDDPAFETVEAITAAAFGQRRKMIRSSLSAYASAMAALGWDVTRRAETLAVSDFIALARAVEAQDEPRGS
jgi:16S rRNA (adenine1518-N6/adenine1519-N6)-dimethyltransferase